MPLSIACSTCRKLLAYPEQHAGKAFRCPHCQGVVQTPLLPAALPVPPTPAPAAVPASAGADPFDFLAPEAAPGKSISRDPNAPVSRLDRGALIAFGGAALMFAAVAGTALVQVFVLWSMDEDVGEAEGVSVQMWMSIAYGEWSESRVHFANGVRSLGTLALLTGSGIFGWGLFECWRSGTDNRGKYWLAGSGLSLAGAIFAALMIPALLLVFIDSIVAARSNRDASGSDGWIVTVKFFVFMADVGALAALACLAEFFGDAVRRKGNTGLGWHLRIFVMIAIASQLGVFFLDFLSNIGISMSSKDSTELLARRSATTIRWFLVWFLGSIGLLGWSYGLMEKVRQGIRYSLEKVSD